MEIFTEIKVKEVLEHVAKRTKNEWRCLYFRRVLLVGVNIAFVVACCYTIVISNVKKQEIVEFFDKYIEQHDWIPNRLSGFV